MNQFQKKLNFDAFFSCILSTFVYVVAPEYIHHYASAVFINESFWNDSNKVLDELKMEGTAATISILL